MKQLVRVTRSFLDTSLPDLIPPTPGAFAGAPVGGEVAPAGPCAAVTRSAVEAVITRIEEASLEADKNVTLNGEGVPGASYPAAATFAQAGLAAALDTMNTLFAFLDDNSLFEPPDGRVTNASASFNIFGYARETIVQLHFARHWAAVSASSNRSVPNAAPAVECAERVSEALSLIEPLSADATRCYLRAFLPQPWPQEAASGREVFPLDARTPEPLGVTFGSGPLPENEWAEAAMLRRCRDYQRNWPG